MIAEGRLETSEEIAKIEVESLQMVFPSEGRQEAVEVLKEISFSLGSGSFLSILGPSGAGKTTLIKIIAGLLNPTTGLVKIDGRPIDRAIDDGAAGIHVR